MVNNKVKKLGQVFTPRGVVVFMLDTIGYLGDNIIKKHILDNSCGNGNFLVEIVKRYLFIVKEKCKNDKEIKYELETYIHGIEVDPLLHKECLRRLNSIFLADYDIRLGDTLT